MHKRIGAILGSICILLLYGSSASAKFGPAVVLQNTLDTCQRLMFSVVNQPAFASTNSAKAVEKLAHRAKAFRESAGEDYFERKELLAELGEKWKPVVLARVNELGIGVGASESKNRTSYKILIDRKKLLGLYPELAPLLPEGYQLVLTPVDNLSGNHQAYFGRYEREIGLPLSLIYRPPSDFERQILVHELVHLRLHEIRVRENNRRLVHMFNSFHETYEKLRTKLNPEEVREFSPEETIAYLVNGLNSFEGRCAGKDPKEDKFTGGFKRAKIYLSSLLDVLLPVVFNNEGYFSRDEYREIVFTEKSNQVAVRMMAPNGGRFDGKDLEVIQSTFIADMNSDRELLTSLREVFEEFRLETKFDPKPEHCGKTEPLWNFLSSLGLNTAELRLAH